ncbi:efflux RND transporter periplasmic adaptor subunit [Aerophototrophica crusticola]|uniref:Efflux RND transporter periplasmic adaptor subunit n=1 Tax=Aerophototrophica crusticola TaxID=1709002 RepID=A0A858R9J6_9PROT|nr:efflux RND transporter periplasmic adaptor subunit [Rhodospirillaceae bacterium B3]
MDSIDASYRREPVPVGPDITAEALRLAIPGQAEARAPGWRGALPRPNRAWFVQKARRYRRGLTALGILLAGVAGLAILVGTAPEVAREAKPERVWTVDAVTAARATHQPDIRLSGTLVAGRTVELRALVAGTVESVSPALRNGGVIRAGETLLQVEPLDYELGLRETRAEVQEAEARLAELRATAEAERSKQAFARQQLDVRERDLTRTQSLFEKGTVAAPRLEQAQVALAQERQAFAAAQNATQAADARVQQQQATLERLRAQLVKAETDLARTRLVAPFDGFVGSVNAEAGMRLSPADRVAVLSGAEGLEAEVNLPTDAYGRLVQDGQGIVGREAQVVWDMGSARITYPARVDRVADRISSATGGVGVFVRLEGNFTEQPLRPGAFVQVVIPDRRYAEVVHLPATALHGDGTVYVVGAEDRLEARKVAVAARTADSVFVASGVNQGDRVVTTRFQEIAGGVKVGIRTPAEAAKDAAEAAAEAKKQEGGQ